jgi:hypothetical protein
MAVREITIKTIILWLYMAVHMISHNAPTHIEGYKTTKRSRSKGRGPSFYGHVCMMYETFRGSNIRTIYHTSKTPFLVN